MKAISFPSAFGTEAPYCMKLYYISRNRISWGVHGTMFNWERCGSRRQIYYSNKSMATFYFIFLLSGCFHGNLSTKNKRIHFTVNWICVEVRKPQNLFYDSRENQGGKCFARRYFVDEENVFILLPGVCDIICNQVSVMPVWHPRKKIYFNFIP